MKGKDGEKEEMVGERICSANVGILYFDAIPFLLFLTLACKQFCFLLGDSMNKGTEHGTSENNLLTSPLIGALPEFTTHG